MSILFSVKCRQRECQAGRLLAPCDRSGPDVCVVSASRAPVGRVLFVREAKNPSLTDKTKDGQRKTEANGS